MAAKVDAEGILDCMVLQPCSDYGTYQNSAPETIEEVWKGPTYQMIDATDGIRVFGTSFRTGYAVPSLSNSDTWRRGYARPSLPSGWYWMLDSVRIENGSPAGDHSFLRLRMVAKNSAVYPEGAAAGGTRDWVHTFWSIEWAARQASALVYLAGKKGRCEWARHVDESKSGEGQTLEVNDLAPMAKLAADCMRQYSASSLKLEKYQFAYYGEIYKLPVETADSDGVNPQKVVDKYLAGIGPLLHYPIVKRTTTAKFKRSDWTTNPPKWGSASGVEDTLAKDLDKIVDLPWNQLPFDFQDQNRWKWIKTADNFQTTPLDQTTLQYTRTEVWWGDLSWDEDFYGTNRWEIGS